MATRVVAVVITHDQPNFLKDNLDSISNQTFDIERVLVVNTSTNGESDQTLEKFKASSARHQVLSLPSSATFAEALTAGVAQVLPEGANLADYSVWVLHDDMVAEPNALAEMVRVFEISPSTAIAGPKQFRFDNQKLIAQFGLSLTRGMQPFSLVHNELDQGQHDATSDVLAVSTAGMLIRAEAFIALGGLNLDAPPLAQDIELGLRARLAGYRVVGVAGARVRHAQLSINGKTSRRFLGGSVRLAVRKAQLHLRMQLLPLPIALAYWLLLPALAIFSAFAQLFFKRPDRIFSEVGARLWAFATIGARLSGGAASGAGGSRGRLGSRARAIVKPLYASRELVAQRNRLALDAAELQANLQGATSGKPVAKAATTFGEAGGFWLMLALTAFSWRFVPQGEAVFSKGLLPLSKSWLALFNHAGASFQQQGFGLAAPSDPINWVYLAFGSFSFLNPTLAITIFILLAKATAFMGAWRLASTVTAKAGLRTLFGLAYALWPALTNAQSAGEIGELIAAVFLPWLVFATLRLADIGSGASSRSAQQSWSWLGLSGLLAFICSASAPSLLPVLIVGWLTVLGLTKGRRAKLLWLPALTAVMSLSYWFFLIVGQATPLAVLSQPGIATDHLLSETGALLTGSSANWLFGGLAITVVAMLAGFSSSTAARWAGAFAALTFAIALYEQQLQFATANFLNANDTVLQSVSALQCAIAIALCYAVVSFLDSLRKGKLQGLVKVFIALAALAPLAIGSATAASALSYGDNNLVPAIVAAEGNTNTPIQLLILRNHTESAQQATVAELTAINGLHQDEISNAYRFATAKLSTSDQSTALASAVASLVVGNDNAAAVSALVSSRVGFVLLSDSADPASSATLVALNSDTSLTQVAKTKFGLLYQVKPTFDFLAQNPDPRHTKGAQKPLWSITKVLQLAALLGFILLALPTARLRKPVVSNDLGLTEGEGN